MSARLASRNIAALSSSRGIGPTPGSYHFPKGVPSSICRSYTETWSGENATASASDARHASRVRPGKPEIKSRLHENSFLESFGFDAASTRSSSRACASRSASATAAHAARESCTVCALPASLSTSASKDCAPSETRVTPLRR